MYSITLQTTDNVITSGDRIGQLQFAASSESDGSAAISIAGSVYVQAEGSFQSASNAASIVLATAAADASAAVGRIKVTDNGHIVPMAADSYDLGDSTLRFKDVHASGGVFLADTTPAVTTNKLYNEGGTLKFNGSAVGGGSYTAGSGLVLVGDEFNTAGTASFEKILFDNTDAVQIGLYSEAAATGIAIGYQAGSGASDIGDNVFIGNGAGAESFTAHDAVIIGWQAGYDAHSDGTVAVGREAGKFAYMQDGVAIGNRAGMRTSWSATNDLYKVCVGADAGYLSSNADYAVHLGYQAGYSADSQWGVGIGYRALKECHGARNLEILCNSTSPSTSVIGTSNTDKLHIATIIIGDHASKLLAIGNVTSADITPDATLEILPNAATDVGLIVQGATSQTADFAQFQNSSETVLSHIDSTTRTIYDVDTILSTPSTKGIGPYGKSVSIFSQTDGSITAQFFNDDVGNHYTALNAPELRLFNGTTYLQSLRDGLFGADDGGLAIYDSDGTTSGILQCGAIKTPIQSNTDGATVTFDMDVSNLHTVTLAGNRTLAVSNVDGGQRFIIRLAQDNTGIRTITWWSNINWPGGLEPILTNTPNAVDVFGFIATAGGNYDGFVIGYDL